MFKQILLREISLYAKRFGETLNLAAMFVMATSFFVMSLPHGTVLTGMATGILWVCALLVLALVQYRIFLSDHEDGTVEQWLFLSLPLEMIVLAKGLAHWLMTCVPFVVLVPLLVVMLGAELEHMLSAVVSIAVGSLAFVFIGSMAASLSLRFRSRDLLTTLLVLPLAVPMLIFGASASTKPITFTGEWMVLFAYAVFIVPFSCMASAYLLRVSQE